jgi:hypothetical protein
MKGDSFSSAHTWGKCSFVTEIIEHVDYSVSMARVANLVPRAMPVRVALALGKLTTGTPKFRGPGFVGMHVKPITAQKKFNFPRANAILAHAQALLWVRD